MKKNDGGYDDLTAIKYIGPAWQQCFRDRMQVRTYRDLAALSVDNIEKEGKAVDLHEPRSRIEKWIADAEALADKAEEEKKEKEKKKKEAAVAEVVAPAEPVAEPTNSPEKDGNWKEYATFLVYFEKREVEGQEDKRIKVHHKEEDETREWAGLTPEHFLWMLEQAGESPTMRAPKPKEPTPAVEPEGKAEVNISEIRVYQPPKAKKPLASSTAGRPLQKELSAGKPFALEVLFSLEGEAAPSVVKKKATYRARVIANEIDTDVGTPLGDTEPEAFVEGTLDYSVRSPKASLEAGEYRLWALITVQATNVQPNFLEIPSLKVV